MTTEIFGPDGMAGALYNICEDEWSFKLIGDQWWSVSARCKHKKYHTESVGILYLSEAMRLLVEKATLDHKENYAD